MRSYVNRYHKKSVSINEFHEQFINSIGISALSQKLVFQFYKSEDYNSHFIISKSILVIKHSITLQSYASFYIC